MSKDGMRSALACIALLLAALFMAAAPARAQSADPRVDWSSADSAHFRVHYRAAQRQQAEQVARAAERAWPRITQALQWQPRSRTEIVVYTELDIANGFSTPLPFNLIGVMLTPPDEGQLLDNSPWLDLLLVHEFTHVVHLDKVRGAPRVLQAIFGRVAWFVPNLFEPGWVLEGQAVYNESEPAAGRGRLKGPMFEAWLRAERAHGFIKLAELNADGRALPLAKQYLYGAYFFEFLARRYGADKPQAFVERYSGNIVPRLHSNPVEATGKPMDELWDEFLADLAQQVDLRAEPIHREPEMLGERIAGPLFDIPAVAALPDGALLAALDDGLGRSQLVRLGADGSRQVLTGLNSGTRIDVAPDGRVLVAQPDLCQTYYLAYDLYRLEGESLQPITHCAHLRRAAYAGPRIVALQLDGGRTRLLSLAADGSAEQVIYAPEDGSDLVDLAAAPDGRSVAVISHRGADWRLLRFDLSEPAAAPRLLLARSAPMHTLRHGRDGLEMVLQQDGTLDVWRLEGGALHRLTHAYTAVTAQAGTAADASLATVSISAGGYELRRLKAPTTLQTLPVDASVPPTAATPDPTPVLDEGRSYSALRTVYPRSWLPAITSDRGLTAYGAMTNGADALGWHQYAALLQWETSQKQALGSLEYLFLDANHLALSRTLAARAWTGDSGKEHTTIYDRRTKAQWVSVLPWLRLERRMSVGIGAAYDQLDRIDVDPASSARLHDERIAAALADYDSSGGNWYSEGANRGQHATLLYETYKPFTGHTSDGAPPYDGSVLRADLRAYVPLASTVLGLRWTEAHANGNTRAFQLGGATDDQLQLGPVLNSRNLSLRGYRGDESALLGRNARVATIEWRTPLADIDRHGMVPPLGIDRLSGSAFFDIGGAWDSGARPARYHRGAGFELLGEVKLLYALELQLRLGVARALDEPRGTRAYLTAGRAF